MEQVVVVGFDGSKSSMEALRWAASEAEGRGWDIRVIESWRDALVPHRSWREVWDDPGLEEREAQAELEATVDAVAVEHPSVGFAAALTDERPSKALTQASAGVPLVVVGARGRGGFASLLLGSVSQHVAVHGSSNLVVVRGDVGEPGQGVVVGVDGSEPSRVALAWAAEQARRRGEDLRVVLAWSWMLPVGEHGPEPMRGDYSEADALHALRAIVDDVLGDDPGVSVELQTVCGLPAAALVERGHGAALLVVGPRTRTGAMPATLGSVALQVLHHAPCPLAIVKHPDPSGSAAVDR